MKKFFSNIKKKVAEKTALIKCTIKSTRGEGYIDSGIKILISVVIGALLLAGLYTLFNSNIMPTVTQKIQELFNFKG